MPDTIQLTEGQDAATLASIAQQAEQGGMDLASAQQHEQGETKEPSLEETVSAIVDEHRDNDASTVETDAPRDEATADPPTAESDEAKKKAETEADPDKATTKEPEAKPELTADQKQELEASFQQSERFQEMHKQIEESKPYIDWAKYDIEFMQKHNLTLEDWNGSRELLALSKTDPDTFWAKLDLMRENYDIAKGTKLPKDLQAAVDSQELSIDLAKKVALERLKLRGLEANQQTIEQRQQQDWSRTIATTADEWDKAKAKLDADFRPKKQGEKDGKYELVQDLALTMLQKQPPKTAMDIRSALDAAYERINTYTSRFRPPVRQRPNLSNNGSRNISSSNGEPASLADAVQQAIGRKYGIKLGPLN